MLLERILPGCEFELQHATRSFTDHLSALSASMSCNKRASTIATVVL